MTEPPRPHRRRADRPAGPASRWWCRSSTRRRTCAPRSRPCSARTTRATLEVVLALGPSRDRTDEIAAELAAADDRVRLVANPTGATGAGLNLARRGRAARRRRPARRARAGAGRLRAGGGRDPAAHRRRQRRRADGRRGRHRLPAGGRGGDDQPVRRRPGQLPRRRRGGAGADGLPRRRSGARCWTGSAATTRRSCARRTGSSTTGSGAAAAWCGSRPRLHVSYRPRSTLRALARQYRDYGRWRRVVMREHEGTANLRYLAPPVGRGRRGRRAPSSGWPAGGRRCWRRRATPRACSSGSAVVGSRAAAAVAGLAAARPRHDARRVGRRLPHQPARAARHRA